MRRPRLWAAALALAGAAASCGPSGPPPAIPREMAACVPSGAVLLAGARLDTLRASPIYARLPASVLAFLKPLQDASGLLAVFNGSEILLIAQGHFRELPPGATMAGSDLMLSGSPVLIQAALAQRRSGAPGSADLLAPASAAAAGSDLWIATRGKVNLPLTGDGANLIRFLSLADFATLSLKIEPLAQLDAVAQCSTATAARHVEETLRAFLSLAVAGLGRQPQLQTMLSAVDVRREESTVHATLKAPANAIPQVFEYFGR